MVVPSLKGICGSYVDGCIMEGRLDDIGVDNYLYEYIMDYEGGVNTDMMMLHDRDTVLYVIKERIMRYIGKLREVVVDTSNDCMVYGEVQSGKTKLIVACCWYFQHICGRSSFLFIRNVRQDYYQLRRRIDEFNKKYVQNREYYLDCHYSKDLENVSDGVTVCLMNKYQLNRVLKMVYNFREMGEGIFTRGSRKFIFNGVLENSGVIRVNDSIYTYNSVNTNTVNKYRLDSKFRGSSGMYKIYEMHNDTKCNYYIQIDEVDTSKKSMDNSKPFDMRMSKLLDGSLFSVGYTATPVFTLLSNQFRRVVKMDRPNDYVGIDGLKILFDYSEDKIYGSFMSKKHGIMLHNTKYHCKKHHEIAVGLLKYDGLVSVVHNGNGVVVYSRNKVCDKSRSKNGYYIHRCINTPISVVLQRLKDNGVTHVSVVSRLIASRGMSYVSSDYRWHITDQILLNYNSTMDNLIQSMRCCGVWSRDREITLWTSEKLKKKLLQSYGFIGIVMGLYEEGKVYESTSRVITSHRFDRYYSGMYSKSGNRYSWIRDGETYMIELKN